MKDQQKAEALIALAEEHNFEAAARRVAGLKEKDWAALLKEAASFFAPPAKPAKPAPTAAEPSSAAKAEAGRAVLFTDGACRGNPGPSSAGASLMLGQDEVGLVSHYLGVMTNNQAEYKALIMGLEMALNLDFNTLSLRLDSQLIVRQVQGRYKVKNQGIKPLFNRVQTLLKRLKAYDILHIERALNSRADALANLALDNR